MALAPRLAINRRSHVMALMEELVEEILLRIPPDEPAHLIRAALICKDWCRVVSGGEFRRRHRRFHRTPPLLGYIYRDFHTAIKFIPTTSFSPPPPAGESFEVLDCRHGPFPHLALRGYTGAVLCARHGCDHLDCHDGPFLVIFVGVYYDKDHNTGSSTHTSGVYSSETGAWSAQTPGVYDDLKMCGPCLLIGDALYVSLGARGKILKYDLGHGLSVVDKPPMLGGTLAMDIDGGLGFVQYYRNCIYTWSRQAGVVNGVGGWVRHNVAELEMKLIPSSSNYVPSHRYDMIRFAEGTNTILFSLYNYIDRGVFTLDLKSRQVRKVGETCGYRIDILPYMSFYTPDLAKGKLSPQ
ncbi:hypothetical protein PVAP13_5NG223962 [Panicum virgatum]|uniref:F-box domain-containing protein n=1 Tax=Panicum virgatum TaxID=38727 RepID=A0A8T0RUR2_PANVG|nr:hypothetical protein PVAP13_5NG223962 [Panicum virgatum]